MANLLGVAAEELYAEWERLERLARLPLVQDLIDSLPDDLESDGLAGRILDKWDLAIEDDLESALAEVTADLDSVAEALDNEAGSRADVGLQGPVLKYNVNPFTLLKKSNSEIIDGANESELDDDFRTYASPLADSHLGHLPYNEEGWNPVLFAQLKQAKHFKDVLRRRSALRLWLMHQCETLPKFVDQCKNVAPNQVWQTMVEWANTATSFANGPYPGEHGKQASRWVLERDRLAEQYWNDAKMRKAAAGLVASRDPETLTAARRLLSASVLIDPVEQYEVESLEDPEADLSGLSRNKKWRDDVIPLGVDFGRLLHLDRHICGSQGGLSYLPWGPDSDQYIWSSNFINGRPRPWVWGPGGRWQVWDTAYSTAEVRFEATEPWFARQFPEDKARRKPYLQDPLVCQNWAAMVLFADISTRRVTYPRVLFFLFLKLGHIEGEPYEHYLSFDAAINESIYHVAEAVARNVPAVVNRGRVLAGARSEQAAADALEADERLWWVVPGVQLGTRETDQSDADLVVVGPAVTVVEVKTGRGQAALSRTSDGNVNVTVDGRPLKAERGQGVINQVRRQKELLTELLSTVGLDDRLDVKAVVCVVGQTNPPVQLGDVTVCSANDLADVISGFHPTLHDPGQAETLANLLAFRD